MLLQIDEFCVSMDLLSVQDLLYVQSPALQRQTRYEVLFQHDCAALFAPCSDMLCPEDVLRDDGPRQMSHMVLEQG